MNDPRSDRPEDPEAWEPVLFRPDARPPAGLRVRILCGRVDPSSPFIEAGCAHSWREVLEEPDVTLSCPNCGRRCHEEHLGVARRALERQPVFVLGCTHRAMTFSRRSREPFFSPLADGGASAAEG